MSYDVRVESKKNWAVSDINSPTITELEFGALLRIADATEVMAKNYNDLIRQRDDFKRMYYEKVNRINQLERSNASLRGWIKRLKK